MNKPEFCPLCPNHCSAEDPHCGRGRAYFANLNGDAPDDFQEQPRMHDHEDHSAHHHPHDPGEHPRHHHHPHREINADSDLETLLRACGHRLHHGMPGGPHGSQEQLIRMLQERGGIADQRELQERMRIRPASASELLTKLEEKGLIERRRDEEDRRRVRIVLTDAGSAQAQAPVEEDQPDLFQALSAEEQDTLRTLLLKVLESWK